MANLLAFLISGINVSLAIINIFTPSITSPNLDTAIGVDEGAMGTRDEFVVCCFSSAAAITKFVREPFSGKFFFSPVIVFHKLD